jgi:hypothetical protein
MTKTRLMVLIISIATVWTGGCQEEQTPDMRQARLIAMENKELKAQLLAEAKKREDEIKNLKAQCQAEAKKQDDQMKNLKEQIKKRDNDIEQYAQQLAECEQIKSEEMQKAADKEVWGMVMDLSQKNEQLLAENERLQAELDKMKGQK